MADMYNFHNMKDITNRQQRIIALITSEEQRSSSQIKEIRC